MKMKSIFLSMLAIAALASCTKENFNVDPPGPKGDEMVVELTINGSSLSSKAGIVGTPADNKTDKTISNLTVFGVNTVTGTIITKKYFGTLVDGSDPGSKKVTFATTDQTTQIHVIANIGADLTGGDNPLNVNTLKALQNVSASLIVPATREPKQTQGDVLMSGFTTTVSPSAGEGLNATASVTLNFIASKIILKALQRTTTSTGTYGTDFQFKHAIMTNVQTNAYYVRGTDSYIDAIAGDIRPAITAAFATGRTTEPQTDTKVADFSQEIPVTITTFDDTHPIKDIAYWYVFENPDATKHTTLLIEYVWKEKSTVEKMTTMYFPVTFGGGDKDLIEPGKSYGVTLTFNNNFKPEDQGGGGGGGGTTDPDTPIVPGSVDVTVVPAEWSPATADKDFGK